MTEVNGLQKKISLLRRVISIKLSDERSENELSLSIQNFSRSLTPKFLKSKQTSSNVFTNSPLNFKPLFKKLEKKHLKPTTILKSAKHQDFKSQLQNTQMFTSNAKEKKRSLRISMTTSTQAACHTPQISAMPHDAGHVHTPGCPSVTVSDLSHEPTAYHAVEYSKLKMANPRSSFKSDTQTTGVPSFRNELNVKSPSNTELLKASPSPSKPILKKRLDSPQINSKSEYAIMVQSLSPSKKVKFARYRESILHSSEIAK